MSTRSYARQLLPPRSPADPVREFSFSWEVIPMSDEEREALARHWLSLLTVPKEHIGFIRDSIDRLLDRINEARATGESWNRAMRQAMQLDVEAL